jgi:hypothetical protein
VSMSVEARDPLYGDEAMKAFLVSAKKAVGFVRSPDDAEKMMYRSASFARESNDDLTIVVTFSLLGLALSLLAIGRAGFIDPEYMANLLLLF